MNALADFNAAWDAWKMWAPPLVAGSLTLLLWTLTRRAVRADVVRGQATQVEQLYIGEAKGLFTTLQEELRTRIARIGALEAERETLRSALTEERQMFETIKQRHRELIAFMNSANLKVPDELHL